MAESEVKQRLAAILAADVVSYSRLMAANERATIAALDECRALFRDAIGARHGRVVDTAGDSVLAVFESATGAVEAALAVQEMLDERNADFLEDRRMRFRIGVNLGDIFEKDDGTIYGDGVNVAARLESLAEPGGVCVSDEVHRQANRHVAADFDFIGAHEVKNIAEPVRAYHVTNRVGQPSKAVATRRALPRLILAVALVVISLLAIVIWTMTGHSQSPPVAAIEPGDPVTALPKGPTIAVLPFKNLSGDPEQEYFTDGITEDIIAKLTRFRELFVPARHTTFQYRDEQRSVQDLGELIGVRYLLEGSVRRADETIRVTVELYDAATGQQLWAQAFDRSLTTSNIFEIQDEITAEVVGKIGGAHGILAHERPYPIGESGVDNMADYDCVLQARVYHYDHTPARHLVARNCLEETVESSPGYVEAVAELAYIYLEEYRHDYNPRPDSVARGIAMARRAVALDSRNATAHWTLALGHFSSGNLDAFYAEADRALELNPNDATMLQFIAHFIAPTGQWEKGLALMSKSQKLNPGAPNWSHVVFALDHYRKGEYEMALARFNRVDTGLSTSIKSQKLAILGQLDRRDESDALLAKLQDTVPGYSVETARRELVVKRHFDPDLAAKIVEGLRKAGVPETSRTK